MFRAPCIGLSPQEWGEMMELEEKYRPPWSSSSIEAEGKLKAAVAAATAMYHMEVEDQNSDSPEVAPELEAAPPTP